MARHSQRRIGVVLTAAAVATAISVAHGVKNYTHGVDTDFVLDRGDLYLYPDFLTPSETRRWGRPFILLASVCPLWVAGASTIAVAPLGEGKRLRVRPEAWHGRVLEVGGGYS